MTQQQTSPVETVTETSVTARNTSPSAPVRPGSAFRQTGHSQQRAGHALTSLQSPFATSDVQHATAQPEQIHPAPARKRTRCQSSDLDSKPLSKIPHLAHRQHNITAVAAPDPNMITIHKPTPQRPSAASPCCFAVVSAAQPLQHSQLKPSSLNVAQATSLTPPAAVPSSPATAATFANAAAISKLPETAPAIADKGSPSRPDRSQDLKSIPGKHARTIRTQALQVSCHCLKMVIPLVKPCPCHMCRLIARTLLVHFDSS